MFHYRAKSLALGLAVAGVLTGVVFAQTPIKVGSKNFPESQVLGEIMAQLLESRGFEVKRRLYLGGTIICYRGLQTGEIDLYPEYSGTIEQAILKRETRSDYAELQSLLRKRHDLELLRPFGFNNTYALAVRSDFAEKHNLETISDLVEHPDFRFGLSHEFLERGDGWQALASFYGLRSDPRGMEHALCYPALLQDKIDVMDVYSTDGETLKYDLFLLEDDRNFFPDYLAGPLVRTDLPEKAKAVLDELGGIIDEATMQSLNAEITIDKRTFAAVANDFLVSQGLVEDDVNVAERKKWSTLIARGWTHIQLTMSALAAAIALAIPLGVIIFPRPSIARPVLYMTGLLQTIPSIALLAFMLPFFGIGVWSALVALFLYALLPILRNTVAALNALDPVIRKVSIGMGMTRWQRLRHIELPLALPTILAGVRTAAVISVGTATLAAFIGAGGLGQYIFTGITLNDTGIIMWGAIPAAILAIIVELMFEWIEKVSVPAHLRQGLS